MDLIAAWLPDGLAPWVAGLLVVASFFTSALTAAFGVGGGVAMLALMGLFVPVASLIPVHGAVQLGSNTGRAWHQRAFVRLDVAAPFIAGSVIGAIGGAFLVVQLPDALLKLMLGSFVLRSDLGENSRPRARHTSRPGPGQHRAGLRHHAGWRNRPAGIGNLRATSSRTTARRWWRPMQSAMTTQHFLKIVVFGVAGFAFHTWLPLVIAMVLSGYLGTVYGTRLLEKIPEEAFRKWFRIGLSVLALDLIRRGVAGLV